MDYSTPALPVLHHLLGFAQTHVHWLGNATNHLILSPSSLPTFNLSQHQGLFQWVGCLIPSAHWKDVNLTGNQKNEKWQTPMWMAKMKKKKKKTCSSRFIKTTGTLQHCWCKMVQPVGKEVFNIHLDWRYMSWWPSNSTTGYITDRNACPPASKDMHKRGCSKLLMIVLTQSSSTVGWVNEWWCNHIM